MRLAPLAAARVARDARRAQVWARRTRAVVVTPEEFHLLRSALADGRIAAWLRAGLPPIDPEAERIVDHYLRDRDRPSEALP